MGAIALRCRSATSDGWGKPIASKWGHIGDGRSDKPTSAVRCAGIAGAVVRRRWFLDCPGIGWGRYFAMS